jgi:hypothetical protein
MAQRVFFIILVCVCLAIFFLWPRPSHEIVFAPDTVIGESIAHGVSQRFIYLDDYYSDAPGDLTVFLAVQAKVITGYESFTTNRDKLFRSGLLVMCYGMNNKQLSADDFKVVKKFVDSGGRVLLLCPAWVYGAYEKKKVEDLSFYKIAKEFGLTLTAQYADAPLKVVDPVFQVGGIEEQIGGVFSSIQIGSEVPVMVGKNGSIAAARAQKGKARLFLWAQNNLFNGKLQPLALKILKWLLEV